MLAVLATLFSVNFFTSNFQTIALVLIAILIGGAIGSIIARKIEMTAMPQLVAAFHSSVGLAAVFVALAAFYAPEAFNIGTLGNIKTLSLVEMSLGAVIGAITFSGSVIAFGKLQGIMSGAPIVFKGQHMLNLFIGLVIVGGIVYFCFNQDQSIYLIIIALAFLIGFLIISDWWRRYACCCFNVKFVLRLGSCWNRIYTWKHSSNYYRCFSRFFRSNLIYSNVCAAMNRSFISVILGGFGAEDAATSKDVEQRPVKEGSADDAAFIMKNAGSVIIVPGYGMAVAQAQHAIKEMTDALKNAGVKVTFAIHPVAGRMPGHMNVLLAEANVPYDEVFELEDINSEFSQADVAFVIGANDVTNPIAKTDPASPIYGMPILDVEKANTVLFVKRGSGGLGYAGVDNELFYRDNTMMLFSDAKKMVEGIVKAL